MHGGKGNDLGNGAILAPDAPRLRGWKDIARWFNVDERTVKRWEATRGLPVHRVPGEARAPVFAYPGELTLWLQSRGPAAATNAAEPAEPPPPPPRRRLAILAAVALALLALAAWQGWRVAETRQQEARDRTADVRQLAHAQVAELSDRLEQQPGTVRLRAQLAGEAAAMLARVAAQPGAGPALRLEAAEAYRRLAIVQNAVDRPSLRDRAAARASLAAALRLADGRDGAEARLLRAHILADAARQAAAAGEVAAAPPMLAEADRLAAGAPPTLRAILGLAASEVANWQGEYRRAITLATPIAAARAGDPEAALRRITALDFIAEAHFYAGDKPAAIAGYRAAVAAAAAGAARWPAEPRFRWARQRQQWNLGSSLVDVGQADAALAMLKASRDGWQAMAAADPEDGSVASWVRISRLAYGQALAGAGQNEDAVAELSASLLDRRNWLAGRPGDPERQRAVFIGLNSLADVLAPTGRRGEACTLYAEAQALADRMAAAGSLTRLDRDSAVKLLTEARARYCPGGAGDLTSPGKPLNAPASAAAFG